jgi:ribosomal-protein-alanine N-acetyltransferase
MEQILSTERLTLAALSLNDAGFIFSLVNSPGWLEFIGERNVKSQEDAQGYIQKIIANPDVNYWVVKLKDSETPAGIITLIKRPYLLHHDIGFAFLPEYTQSGYAFEAAAAALKYLREDPAHECILATTIRENIRSVQLLEKLGLHFDKGIQVEGRDLLLFSI